MAAQRGAELTPESIADAALALVDQAGPDALSMRALAAALGVPTMTLHRRLGSRDELLDAMVDHVTADVTTVAGAGEWHERYAALFRRLHDVLVAHPGLVRLRLTRPFLSPGAVRLAEHALTLLQEAGLPPDEAIRAYRAAYLFTLGCAAYVDHLDPAGARHATRTALAALPPERYPYLTSHLGVVVSGVTGSAAFDYGLAHLVDGVRRAAGRQLRSPAKAPRSGRRSHP